MKYPGVINYGTPFGVINYGAPFGVIRVESLRSLRGILRRHPKSACSKKTVFRQTHFRHPEDSYFLLAWEKAPRAGGRALWVRLVGGRREYFRSPPVFAGSLVYGIAWFPQALPPTGRAGQPSPLADVPFRGPLDSR